MAEQATQTTTIAASVEHCFAVATDFEKYPEWAKDVKEAVASGYFYEQREKKTIPELVAALGDWSPVLRSLAADEVAVRPKGKTMVQELIAIAEGKDAWKRQGAAETLGALKVPEAATEQPELCSLAKSASAK